jgi:hypothetical protein
MALVRWQWGQVRVWAVAVVGWAVVLRVVRVCWRAARMAAWVRAWLAIRLPWASTTGSTAAQKSPDSGSPASAEVMVLRLYPDRSATSRWNSPARARQAASSRPSWRRAAVIWSCVVAWLGGGRAGRAGRGVLGVLGVVTAGARGWLGVRGGPARVAGGCVLVWCPARTVIAARYGPGWWVARFARWAWCSPRGDCAGHRRAPCRGGANRASCGPAGVLGGVRQGGGMAGWDGGEGSWRGGLAGASGGGWFPRGR